ncbi:MAG: DUF424 family protein [Candidatus Aenigmarchaeota archaeon]|nr:DUF424 family protein [Candidatus Aenigmarchaeota archaeon]
MAFSYKLHAAGSQSILAIADDDVVGKAFEEGELSIEVTHDFYGGNLCSEDEIPELASRAAMINAVGKRIVALLARDGTVDKSMVLEIGGVSHAQVIRI